MKVLLTTLNSKYVHSNLALKYLYAVALDWEADVDIKEFTINNPSDYVFGEWIRGGYDVICLSCYIWNIRQTCDLAEDIKRARPQTVIALGGPEVSFETEAFLREHPWADFVLMGEGEGVFYRWMEQLFSEMPDYGSVRGLAWRKDGTVVVNDPAPPLKFESVSFPYAYLPAEDDKVLYYESSRGCPFRCAYCLSSVDKNIRVLPLERVKSELSYFIYKKVKQVKFIDRTFNFNAQRSRHIFRYLIENDNGVTNFHFEMCGDLIDDETLELLKTARKGLFQFEIGVQSTDPQVLRSCGRGGNLEKLSRAVKQLRELGTIHLHLDLIAGLPGETFQGVRTSFNDVYNWKPDALQLGFLKVLKGSPMAEMAQRYGIIARRTPPYETIRTDAISAEELVRLKMIEEVLDLYWNRGGFRRTLDVLTDDVYSTPFDFYQEFSGFYYEKGYQHCSHKKEDLYRILDRFVRERVHTLGEGASDRGEPRNAALEIRRLLKRDMADTLNPDAIKKFEKKGWELT